MSETLTSVAMSTARRTASNSVTLLKGLTRSAQQKPVAEAAPEPKPAPAAPASTPSVISASTQMIGSISTSEELHVQGVIEGDVRASKIIVCAGGVVKGGLTAEVVIIHGSVEGSVEGQHVLMRGSAAVNGEITHHTLGIDTTAVFEGSVKRMPASDAIATAAE